MNLSSPGERVDATLGDRHSGCLVENFRGDSGGIFYQDNHCYGCRGSPSADARSRHGFIWVTVPFLSSAIGLLFFRLLPLAAVVATSGRLGGQDDRFGWATKRAARRLSMSPPSPSSTPLPSLSSTSPPFSSSASLPSSASHAGPSV